MQPVVMLPLFLPAERTNQPMGLCKVFPYEIEPVIRWGLLTEVAHLQPLPKPCKINFCRKPMKEGCVGREIVF